jgi:hypothetical protein
MTGERLIRRKREALLVTALLSLTLAVIAISHYSGQSVYGQSPVTVGPPVADARVVSAAAWAGVNFGSETFVSTNPRMGNVQRSWIRFDLSGLPAGITIASAKLKLYYYSYWGSTNPSGRIIQVYSCSNDAWAESGITWNNAPSGSCATSPSTATVPSSPGAWMEWSVTEAVQAAYSGDRLGTWMLKDSAETSNVELIPFWASKENTDSSKRSVLEISYSTGPDFTISASPSSRSVGAGTSTTFTVTITATGGYSGSVDLSVSGLPTGATGKWSADPVGPPYPSATLTIDTSASTPGGTYSITIRGSDGTTTRSTAVSLAVSGPAGFAVNVRPGATQIVVTITWTGQGSITIVGLQDPSGTTYTEAGMVLYERYTTNVAADGSRTYLSLKRASYPATPGSIAAGTWTLLLSPSGVTAYTVTVEVT